MKIMKIHMLSAALMAAFALHASAQQEVKLSVKYLPQQHYTTSLNMKVMGSVKTDGNSAMADSLKAKGLSQNLKVALTASGNVDVTTGAESGGSIPVTMRVDNVTAQPSLNGQQIPFVPTGMINGKKVYATASAADGKLHVDSVSGKRLPDSTLSRINDMMGMAMNRMHFPDKTFKPGDTFTQDVPFNMPMATGMQPVNANTKLTYHLVRIAGGKAYFDITQATSFADAKQGKNVAVAVSGKGSMVYEIKEQYPSAFRSDMNINVHASGNDKGKAEAMFTVSTSGTTMLGS